MKTKDLMNRLMADGWRLDRIRGSHHVFTHPEARRSIVLPVHGKEVTDRFAKIILKEAAKARRKD